MKILIGECRKLWGNKQVWLGLFLLLTITVFSTGIDVKKAFGEEDPEVLAAAYEKIEGLSPQDAMAVMGLDQMDEETRESILNRGTDWYFSGYLWPASLISQVCRLADISGYIEETIEEAWQKTAISIFSAEGFERNNLIQTKAAYEKLVGLQTPVGNYTAVETLLSSDMIDLLAALFAIMLLGILIGQERESGILRLYSSCARGRMQLAYAKLAAACIWGMLAYSMCLTGRYTTAVFLAGSGSLDVPVQCLQGAEHSGMLLTIRQFLPVWQGSKMVWLCIKTAQFFVLIHLIQKISVSTLSAGVIWLGESLIYRSVSPVSWLQILRYVVPESLRLAEERMQTYRNVEVFDRAVEQTEVVWLFAWISLLVFTVLSGVLFCLEASGKGRAACADRQGNRKKGPKISGKWVRIRSKRWGTKKESVFCHENYKLYGSCGGLLIIAVSLAFQWGIRGYQLTPSYTYTEQAAKSMIQALEGEVTEKTWETVAYLHRFYETDEETYRVSLQILNRRIDPLCEYLKSQTDQGKRVVLFYDMPWKKYFGISAGQDVQDTFVFLIVLILVGCGQICLDHRHGETAFLYATQGGKEKMFRAKFSATALMSGILVAMYYVPPLIEAAMSGGSITFRYPLCSIQVYENFPDWVTIGDYIAGLTVWRYGVSLILIQLIFCIAEKIRNYAVSVFVCLSVLGLSFLGYFLGGGRIADMGILPYLNGNRMMQRSAGQIAIFGVIGIIMAMGICLCYRRMIKK